MMQKCTSHRRYEMEFSPFHKDILVDMNLWLADCPCPIVCRVIDDEVDVRYLMSISRVCDHNPYVVIDIKTLVEITTKNKSNNSCFHNVISK
jgi:hypothetical protein